MMSVCDVICLAPEWAHYIQNIIITWDVEVLMYQDCVRWALCLASACAGVLSLLKLPGSFLLSVVRCCFTAEVSQNYVMLRAANCCFTAKLPTSYALLSPVMCCHC